MSDFDYYDYGEINYDRIKELAKELKRPASTLIALSSANDPFYIAPARHANAEWVVEVHRLLGGSHSRKLHYRLIVQKKVDLKKNPFVMPNGKVYQNINDCWQTLVTAVRDARYLGITDLADWEDRRAKAPDIYLPEPRSASLWTTNDAVEMPDLPELRLIRPNAQRYHVEVWIEKSTESELLIPLAEKLGFNLVTGQGEVGDEACRKLIERAEESRLPTRVLWISDFDAGGVSMPVGMARKVEFWLRKLGYDHLDIEVRPIVLTKDQCEQYDLPEMPMKSTEKRAGEFFRRYQREATELDALEALHPGALKSIVKEEIERYLDPTLTEREEKIIVPVKRKLIKVNNAVHAEFADRYDELREELDDWSVRFDALTHDVEHELNERAPDLIKVKWPQPREAEEDHDPLFDSMRDYVEQIDRYKEHQDKPVARKSRGMPSKIRGRPKLRRPRL